MAPRASVAVPSVPLFGLCVIVRLRVAFAPDYPPRTTFPDAMPPPDAKLGQALRDVVEDTFKRNDHDALTVKRIRTAAEEKLGLEQGFFKSSSRWNATSKEIIAGEVV